MNPKKNPWLYPSERPWIEFVLIACLSIGSLFSIASLMISAREAKHARIVATARLEVIYRDLMKSEDELKGLKIIALNEERQFHKSLNKSMRVQTELLKQITTHIGIPPHEVDKTLKKDPNY